MDAVEIAVVFGGAALVLLLLRFFFGERESVSAETRARRACRRSTSQCAAATRPTA